MSLLDRAFVKAYSRSHSSAPTSTPVAAPHLDNNQSSTTNSRMAIAEMMQVQDAFASSVLLDESYFRVDVGHLQATRTNAVTRPIAAPLNPAVSAIPTASANRPASVNPTASVNPAVISHTLTAYELPSLPVAQPTPYSPASAPLPSAEYSSTAEVEQIRLRIDSPQGRSQWKPPVIEEPQEYYRVPRDVEQSHEFARAKSETFAREVQLAAKASTQTASAESVATAVLPRPAVPREPAFEPVWEVDAFEFSDTIVALFGDAKLMKSIGAPLDQAVANGLRSILITSGARHAGRTTVAIGIAVSAASAGLRVAVVDADNMTAGLADALRLEVQHDWVEAVRSDVPLDEVAIRSIEDQFTVLPTVLAANNAAVSTTDFDKVMSRLRESFDLVVIDAAPWSKTSIALQNASTIDAAIIVVDARNRDESQLAQIQDQLRRSGVAGLGIVENFT